MLQCQTCGMLIERKPGAGRKPKFCGRRCRDTASASRKVRKPRRPASMEERTCPGCGGKWVTRKAAPNLYCGQACAIRARVEKAIRRPMRECQTCRKEFRPTHQSRKAYCSRECYLLDVGRPRPTGQSTWRFGASDKRHRLRAMAHGVEYEKIRPLDVWERDAWTCGLCGEGINPELRFPHPMSATLDHVVPLSRGGTHTWANVHAAHLGCNTGKGAGEGHRAA